MLSSLTHYQTRNNQQLEQWLADLPSPQSSLTQAMRYGLLLGGKRIRPALVYMTGQLFGCAEQDLDTPASAIECIHAYSLIHDDLPAMDDDDLRRGQATCHVQFDEATAILTGDALQTLAFTILARGSLNKNAEINRIGMVEKLALASGGQGMCMGQSLDLLAEGKSVPLAQLETIHRMKTGALIRCAVQLGALAAGERGRAHLEELEHYADAIGLAFQVQDDILDITSDTQTLGKPQGSDLAANKSTYPALLGLEGAKQKAQSLVDDALQALANIPYDTQLLEDFARFIVERTN